MTDVASTNTEIKLFDWNTLIPNGAGKADLPTINQRKVDVSNAIQQAKRTQEAIMSNFIAQHNVKLDSKTDIWDILTLSRDKLSDLMVSNDNAVQAHKQLVGISNAMRSNVYQPMGSDQNNRQKVIGVAWDRGAIFAIMNPSQTPNNVTPIRKANSLWIKQTSPTIR
jgi:hypothetical protein